ncbi:hypothetical protein BDV59DRAFT_166266 [Aspergillus ambiguus]|uniref:uncharacterized protein n=1 Tax=Aspergillus ambiguus TaxID=176160 RepID=UPI003CCE1DAD
MAFPRALLRASRPSAVPRPSAQFARRTYASASHEAQSSSNLPWMIGSITLLGPGLYYLLGNKPPKQSHHDDHDHGPPKEAHTPAGDSAPQPDRDAEQKTTSAPSKDVPENPGRTTIEVDKGRSDNPYVNEPGKSQKGEGETETVKVKGSVSPERPQA